VLGDPDRAREQALGKLHTSANAGHRRLVLFERWLQADVYRLDDDTDVASVFDDDVTRACRRLPKGDFHDDLH
jgi:hypothetical protein